MEIKNVASSESSKLPYFKYAILNQIAVEDYVNPNCMA
jgi:hypothetical protein